MISYNCFCSNYQENKITFVSQLVMSGPFKKFTGNISSKQPSHTLHERPPLGLGVEYGHFFYNRKHQLVGLWVGGVGVVAGVLERDIYWKK